MFGIEFLHAVTRVEGELAEVSFASYLVEIHAHERHAFGQSLRNSHHLVQAQRGLGRNVGGRIMSGEGKSVPIEVKEVDPQVAPGPPCAGKGTASTPIEAHELVIGYLGSSGRIEVFLGQHARANVLVRPLSPMEVVVSPE